MFWVQEIFTPGKSTSIGYPKSNDQPWKHIYEEYYTERAGYFNNTCMHVTTISDKRPLIWKRGKRGAWEDLKGRKGKKKWCNYIIISKIKWF